MVGYDLRCIGTDGVRPLAPDWGSPNLCKKNTKHFCDISRCDILIYPYEYSLPTYIFNISNLVAWKPGKQSEKELK